MGGRDERQRRDEVWFENFFRAQHPAVRAYARRRVRDGDADDIVADVFATAWACREQLPDEPRPWLYRCAWHRIATRQRADARRARLVARVAAQPGGIGGAAAIGPVGHAGFVGAALGGGPDGADLGWVYDVLDALPPDEAELLRLAAWEGLAPREIAAVLGCTPGPRASASIAPAARPRRCAHPAYGVRPHAIPHAQPATLPPARTAPSRSSLPNPHPQSHPRPRGASHDIPGRPRRGEPGA